MRPMTLKTPVLLLTLLITSPLQAYEPLNRIVAIINDDVIVESELDRRENLILKQLEETQTRLPPQSVLRRQILDRMVLENLQLQIAERNGIKTDDATLNNALRGMARENGITLEAFRDRLESEGVDYIGFREQLRAEITMNRIRQQMVESRIQVSEQEIDNLLATAATPANDNREYRIAHILVSVPDAASPDEIRQAEKRAAGILEKLKSGADFAQTAISDSDGQQALKGGDLGWRQSDKLPSLFTGVIGTLNKGDISDVIRSPSGFHIIKLTDIRGDLESHQVTQTHVRHILLKTDALTTETEATTKLAQIRERIEQGEDYAALARAYSQDPGSASQGGDLGWVTPGTMVPEFEQAMNRLRPGEISQPVHSRFGWHLIEVIDRRSRDNTAEYRRAQAADTIRRRKTEEEMDIWLRRLRDESYVEYLLNPTS